MCFELRAFFGGLVFEFDHVAGLGRSVLRPYRCYAIRTIKFLRGPDRWGGRRSFGK